jgi:4-amino-4-deoxy-L-arabinose transferase-like glycosyltransferase
MPSREVQRPTGESPGLAGRGWWLGCALVLIGALLATVPTVGDIGLTWDEPSYRTSQLVSAHWWEGLSKARSRADLDALLTPEALLYYWPYARFGYNFHPPLAGQLNLLTHALFGGWMKDIPSRRMASVIEYAMTITLAFGFLARRYGAWVGGVAAGALLAMPRVYGDGHIAGTDTPGLLLWVVTALAFWKGLYEPHARKWRVLVGIALGLGFVEKMAAVAVLGPILLWLVAARLPGTFARKEGRYDWVDGLVTSTAMLLPLALAFREVLRLARWFPPPNETDLFTMHPPASLPGAILLVPLTVWLARRLMGAIFPSHPVWGAERPALETWTAIQAFGPVVGWLGNPAWWRETLPRMAHYYQLSADRRGALPDIRIIYSGEVYTYSLPWHNAWVLIAITVPLGILLASVAGLVASLARSWYVRDAIPWYFALHLAFLPMLRMLPTPAHDGVRLFLPTFFFLAAFAGWGVVAIGDALARLAGHRAACRGVVAALVLGSATWQLVAIHPFELSYYNELIGGPRGAWKRGFELSYWYEAFDGETLRELNRSLPRGAAVDFLEPDLISTPSLACLQELGALRGDITLGAPDSDHFPYAWMLTHDSKATPRTRLMFAMEPFYARRPAQLDRLRVVTVDSPEAVSRAWALDALTRGAGTVEVVRAPSWVRESPWLRWLGRFWGQGVTKGPPLVVDERIFTWARTDPEGLRASARAIAAGGPIEPDSGAARLRAYLDRRVGARDEDRLDWRTMYVLRNRPEALVEAVEILIALPDAVRAVLLRGGYTDEATIGGFLDRDVVARKPG